MMQNYFYLDRIFTLTIFGLVHIVIVNSAQFLKSSLGIEIILKIKSSLNLVIFINAGQTFLYLIQNIT